MKRWGNLKPVRFDKSELKTDLGSGNFIFIGSSCDMFAEDIETDWIVETVERTYQFKNNNYFYQTKNPANLLDITRCGLRLLNASICTTIETNRFYPDIMNNAPIPYRRSDAMRELYGDGYENYVTIEPIMKFDLSEMLEIVAECRPRQVNIGADSGGNGLPEPTKKELLDLIEGLKEFTTIHRKSNLARLLK
jgi:DNA repair photolyase